MLFKDNNSLIALAEESKKRSDILLLEANSLRKKSNELESNIHNKNIRINELKGLLKRNPTNDDGGVPPTGTELGNSDTLSGIIKRTLPQDTKYEGQLITALQLVDEVEQESVLKTKQIEVLTIENAKLRESLQYKDRAYELQLDVIRAHHEAMIKAKMLYGSSGIAVGFILSVISN
jgi:hypothetical protein